MVTVRWSFYAGVTQTNRKRKAEDDEEAEGRRKMTSKEVRPGLPLHHVLSVWLGSADGCGIGMASEIKREGCLLFLKLNRWDLSHLCVLPSLTSLSCLRRNEGWTVPRRQRRLACGTMKRTMSKTRTRTEKCPQRTTKQSGPNDKYVGRSTAASFNGHFMQVHGRRDVNYVCVLVRV